MPCEYSVRVRGELDETRVAGILAAANAEPATAGRLTLVEPAGGEGSNQWIRLGCTGLRPRDVKGIFERCGLEINRLLRTRIGPIAMDRALARGRSRPMSDVELDALREIGAGPDPR